MVVSVVVQGPAAMEEGVVMTDSNIEQNSTATVIDTTATTVRAALMTSRPGTSVHWFV